MKLPLTVIVIYFLMVLLQCVLNEEIKSSPNKDVLCTVQKGSHFYDLSSLERKKHSFYSENSHNDSQLVFYISVCHPVKEVPGCGPEDGVCFTYTNNKSITDDTKFVSAGKIDAKRAVPEVMQEGSLRYIYEHGDTCVKGMTELNYKTELHLQCPYSSEEENPNPILMVSPKCLFIFVWITLAACPKFIKPLNDPCVIQFSDAPYPLNLNALKSKTFYKPIGIDFNFELNICGSINGGSCKDNSTILCDTTNPNNPISLAQYSSEGTSFKWWEDALIMSYNNSRNNSVTKVYFYCERTAYTPRVYFSSNGLNVYTFTVYSVNVCSPQMIDCVVEDKKMNVFDLRPLHKKEGNWEVINKKNINQTLLYHINMCGPVNKNLYNKCPIGPIGACQASVSSSGAKNLGFITSLPIVNKDDSLTVLYTGGDSCRDGVKSSSTRINLVCSVLEHQPVFIEITESCEHIFEWHTPAACPLNIVSGNNCRVSDPRFGHNFDLSPLRNNMTDYKTSNGDDTFLVNVCGPLISRCDGQVSNVAVCQLGAEEKNLGLAPAELIFNDGTLIMKFANGSGSCGSGGWSSQIIFLCSHSVEGLDGPQYIHADESACIHHFIWHTTLACPPFLGVNCSITLGDLFYDLTPLSNPNINEIFITFDSKKKYVLNICRSVIHSKESRCAYNAGICLIDLSHKNKTINLGLVKSGPFLQNGNVMIKYEDGDYCNATHKYKTIIEFECADEGYLSYPLLQVEEECTTVFQWSSIYACPQNLTLPASIPVEENSGNCTAINPQTKYVFDLNDMRVSTPYVLHIDDDTTLLLNVCDEVSNTVCDIDSCGACLIHRSGLSTCAGKANKNLEFHMWSTFLEYTDGVNCSNGLSRSTKISFICREKGFPDGPILISDDQDSCAFFINWYTENACERHINCFAHSWDHIFDLSSLVRLSGNYEVKGPQNSTDTYLLNVCHPLNPVIGINCHPGSSVCFIGKNNTLFDLGHPILNPAFIGPEEVHLMYAHGSECPENPGFSLSSRIIFICKRSAGAGEPVFYRTTHDCQTQFKWFTSLVCPPIPSKGECQIAFEAAKTNVDLSPLRRETPYRITYGDQIFLLNLCGASVCNGSGVCTEEDEVSYGLSSQSKLRWDYSSLLLTFYSGSACHSSLTGSRSAEIYFDCDPKAGLGSPTASAIMQSISCMAVFNWRTNLTCLESLYYKPSSHSPTYPTTRPSTFTPDSFTLPSTRNSSDVEEGSVYHDGDGHAWLPAMISIVVVIIVVGAGFYVWGRSSHGRRFYTHAKRTLSRKGYAASAENDTLLTSDAAFVYRVEEDEHVLRV